MRLFRLRTFPVDFCSRMLAPRRIALNFAPFLKGLGSIAGTSNTRAGREPSDHPVCRPSDL